MTGTLHTKGIFEVFRSFTSAKKLPGSPSDDEFWSDHRHGHDE